MLRRGLPLFAAVLPVLVCVLMPKPTGPDLPEITRLAYGFDHHRCHLGFIGNLIVAPGALALAYGHGRAPYASVVALVLVVTGWWAYA